MQFRSDFRMGITVLVGLQILTSVLLEAPADATAEQRARFLAAVEQARSNITIEAEFAIVGEIERLSAAALDGDAEARRAVAAAARRLVAANHRAMRLSDDEAKRLGIAGAWAAALLALLTFGLSIAIVRRLQARLLEPLEELYRVLQANKEGDRFRRCFVPESAKDIRQIFSAVNDLLDRVDRAEKRRAEPETELPDTQPQA